MHVWLNQILTLKIPSKFMGLCGKHASLVKPYIDTQYSTHSNMDFSILTLKFHSNLWDYVANMQVWLNHILTLNIPLTHTWIFLLGETF